MILYEHNPIDGIVDLADIDDGLHNLPMYIIIDNKKYELLYAYYQSSRDFNFYLYICYKTNDDDILFELNYFMQGYVTYEKIQNEALKKLRVIKINDILK